MTTKKPTNASPTNKLVWVDISNFEAVCFNLTREFLTFDQPIPDFSTRSHKILESCLKTPIQQFGGKDLYPKFIDKLAIVFYLLIKNHPFINGNKRVALTALMVILFLNGKWLKSEPLEIYKLAKSVAESDRKNMEKDLQRIKKFIENNLIPLKKRV